MRPVPIVLAALAVAGAAAAAGCSSDSTTEARPTVTVTAPASPTAMSVTDKSSAQLACFTWVTYHAMQKAGDPDAKDVSTAQKVTAGMGDPRWSRVAILPPEEAMSALGALCTEIHYHE